MAHPGGRDFGEEGCLQSPPRPPAPGQPRGGRRGRRPAESVTKPLEEGLTFAPKGFPSTIHPIRQEKEAARGVNSLVTPPFFSTPPIPPQRRQGSSHPFALLSHISTYKHTYPHPRCPQRIAATPLPTAGVGRAPTTSLLLGTPGRRWAEPRESIEGLDRDRHSHPRRCCELACQKQDPDRQSTETSPGMTKALRHQEGEGDLRLHQCQGCPRPRRRRGGGGGFPAQFWSSATYESPCGVRGQDSNPSKTVFYTPRAPRRVESVP